MVAVAQVRVGLTKSLQVIPSKRLSGDEARVNLPAIYLVSIRWRPQRNCSVLM
jgi:hypothetical protein